MPCQRSKLSIRMGPRKEEVTSLVTLHKHSQHACYLHGFAPLLKRTMKLDSKHHIVPSIPPCLHLIVHLKSGGDPSTGRFRHAEHNLPNTVPSRGPGLNVFESDIVHKKDTNSRSVSVPCLSVPARMMGITQLTPLQPRFTV